MARIAAQRGRSLAKTFRYEGYDIITLQLIDREYRIPEPQTQRK